MSYNIMIVCLRLQFGNLLRVHVKQNVRLIFGLNSQIRIENGEALSKALSLSSKYHSWIFVRKWMVKMNVESKCLLWDNWNLSVFHQGIWGTLGHSYMKQWTGPVLLSSVILSIQNSKPFQPWKVCKINGLYQVKFPFVLIACVAPQLSPSTFSYLAWL